MTSQHLISRPTLNNPFKPNNMKFFNSVLLVIVCLVSVSSQNVTFSLLVNSTGNTSTVNLYAELAGGDAPETTEGFTLHVAYNNTHTTVTSINMSPIAWPGPFFSNTNHQAGNFNLDFNETGYVEIFGIDFAGVGRTVNSGSSVLIGTITFEHINASNPDNRVLMLPTSVSGITGYNTDAGNWDINTNTSNSSILPVSLKSFTAQPYDNNSVILDWTTSSEINSSHFDVERSEDGENFEVVGNVLAAGNSDIERNYSFIDRDLNLRRNQSTVFYYRLNMVDNDASQEYSDIKAVRLTNEGFADITLFPNPTAELLNIDINSDLEHGSQVKYEITDIKGRRLITENIDISVQRIHTVNLRDKGLDSGVYMVRLFNDREILSSQKVVLVSR